MPAINSLSIPQRSQLISTLQSRLEQSQHRHKGLVWAEVQARLEANSGKMWSLHQMEETGVEPDVVGLDKSTGEFIFYDCAAERSKGRRSYCYDGEALASDR